MMEPLPVDEERFLADIAAYLESDDPLPALAAALERDLDDVLALDQALTAPPTARSKVSATSEPKPKRRRAKRSRNLARERMQGELRDLRLESAELERQVAELKKQRTLSSGEQLLLASWKQIAAHQRDERHEAECENMRLKHKLQTQVSLARELHHTALSIATDGGGGSGGSEEPTCGVFDGYLLITSQIPRQTCTDAQDTAAFSAMFKEADLVYAQMETVMQHNGLRDWQVAADSQPSHTQAHVAKRRTIASFDGSVALELASAKVYAFAKDTVFRAMWETWEKQYMTLGCVLYDLGEHHPRNTIAATLEYHLEVGGEQVVLQSKAVMKAYPSPKGGFQHVWRTISDASSRFPGVCIDETGWEELEPTRDGGSVMISCSHLRSKAVEENSSSSSSSRTGGESPIAEDAAAAEEAPLADLLAASYEAEIDEVNLRIDGLLLHDGVKN